MDGRPTWTDCDEVGDYVVPNVVSPRDLVSRPDNMDETVAHSRCLPLLGIKRIKTSLNKITYFSSKQSSSYPVYPANAVSNFHILLTGKRNTTIKVITQK